jgi:GAF domain-containing protein
MQSDAPTAGAAQDRGRTVEELERELAEAHRREAATAEVLKIISRSPSDLQPILDAIVETVKMLCGSYDAGIVMRSGDGLKLRAHKGPIPMRAEWPVLRRGSVAARSVLDGKPVHVHNLASAGDEFPDGQADALALGHRTILAVPLVCKGEAIGSVILRRQEVRPFTERQIALVVTFADQAVIAIENTRLFEAEQASKRELQESLEYQTATSEVLGVISKSPSSVQPVFEAIVNMSNRLCSADFGFVYQLRNDGRYHLVAAPGASEAYKRYRTEHPITPGDGSIIGRALHDKRTVHVGDVKNFPETEAQRLGEVRSALAVPLMHAGTAIGVLGLGRSSSNPFSQRQIALVETFADQAVIAIENARLFEAEQASKRDLRESLEYQTATGEVLNVISRSPTEIQPVFDAIVSSAAALCGAAMSNIQLFDGQHLDVAAMHNFTPEARERFRKMYPMRPDGVRVSGRAILTKAVVHVPDILEDPEYPKELAIAGKWRALLSVPMLREDKPVGVVTVAQTEPGPFSGRQVNLLKTFADQAVIAIENARLFEEVQARTRELPRRSRS